MIIDIFLEKLFGKNVFFYFLFIKSIFYYLNNRTYWHAASNDGYDTMNWISKQKWSNGKVYQV